MRPGHLAGVVGLALIAVASAPASALAQDQVGSGAEADLKAFVAHRAALAPLRDDGRLREVSARRWELVAEHDGDRLAAVALAPEAEAPPRGLLPSLCRVALLRDSFVGAARLQARRDLSDEDIEHIVMMASGEARLTGARMLADGQDGRWRFQACRAPLDGIVTTDLDKTGESLLARWAYAEAKRAIGLGNTEAAISLLKRTTLDRQVYQNAVGFMIPLTHQSNPDIAAHLVREQLSPPHMTDPDALEYLGRHLHAQGGKTPTAKSVAQRCLALDPKRPGCRMLLEPQ